MFASVLCPCDAAAMRDRRRAHPVVFFYQAAGARSRFQRFAAARDGRSDKLSGLRANRVKGIVHPRSFVEAGERLWSLRR